MKRVIWCSILIIMISGLENHVSSQLKYSGFVGSFPVEFVVNSLAKSESLSVKGVYMYTRYNDPIPLVGTYTAKQLKLYEQDERKKKRANFTFHNYSQENDTVLGMWHNLRTKDSLLVTLHKEYDFLDMNNSDSLINSVGLLQVALSKRFFFRIFVKPEQTNSFGNARVPAFAIYEKGSGRLMQRIMSDEREYPAFLGVADIDVGDYNFDNITDFSICDILTTKGFTREYFLYDPKQKRFFNSGFNLAWPEFLPKKKTIVDWHSNIDSDLIIYYRIKGNKLEVIKSKYYKRGGE